MRTFPYEGTDAFEGTGHGEVEYALTRAEWQSRVVHEDVRLCRPRRSGREYRGRRER